LTSCSSKKGHDAVVEEIGGCDRGLAIVELGEGELRIGVEEGLLIDAPDALHVADIEGVLGAAIAWALALKFAMRLFLALGLLQRDELAFGKNDAVLRDLGFERLEPLLHCLEIMALPDRTDASGRDRKAELAQLIGDADLPKRGKLQGKLN